MPAPVFDLVEVYEQTRGPHRPALLNQGTTPPIKSGFVVGVRNIHGVMARK
jgi:hypothetical protein